MKTYAVLFNSEDREHFVIAKEENETVWYVFTKADSLSKATEIAFAMNEATLKPRVYGNQNP